MTVADLERLALQRFKYWQLHRAQILFEQICEDHSTRSFAPFMLGEISRRRCEWSQARHWYLEAYRRERTDCLTMYRCAEALYHTGARQDALAWFEHLVDTDTLEERRRQAVSFVARIRLES
jgi:hypothetical protein